MHDEDEEKQHEQPPHTSTHQEPEPQQFQHWPPGMPSYPEFYVQFQLMQISQEQQRVNIEQLRTNQDQLRANQEAMWVNQDFMRKEVHAGFSYIFGGLQDAYPNYFGEPPQFPFGNPGDYGGAGTSGTGGDASDE
ncbi:hypothetical protein Hanom_Chr17g01563241 [Helianthus anomalus]